MPTERYAPSTDPNPGEVNAAPAATPSIPAQAGTPATSVQVLEGGTIPDTGPAPFLPPLTGNLVGHTLRHFRVELLRERADDAAVLLKRYRGALSGENDARNLWRDLRALNQLGVTRGTLQVIGS